jgi:hypothetical protein
MVSSKLRKNLRCAGLVIGILMASGCMPLQQYKQLGGNTAEHLAVLDDHTAFQLSMGKGSTPEKNRIIAEDSRIISPSGKSYGVQVKPHQYDIRVKHDEIRQNIYPVQNDGVLVEIRKNGNWSLHLVIEKEGIRRTVDQQLKISTFYYNPLIHGPPN